MDILGYEFLLPFTSPLWIVHWKSKAPQKRLSNQYTCITVIVSCLGRCYKSYSLKKRWNKKIHKLELFPEWIFALCSVGFWKLVTSPFSLFKKDFLCSIEMSSMMRCLMLWSSAINTGVISELMLWPFGRQCSTLHLTQDCCSSTGSKASRGLTNILGHFLAIYNPIFGLRIKVRSRDWKWWVHHSV